MKLTKGYHLGYIDKKYILWNAKELIWLKSDSLNKAEKEAKEILKQK